MSPPGLRDVYDRLLDAQGPQGWWPAETPTEMAIGAILTQADAHMRQGAEAPSEPGWFRRKLRRWFAI